LKIISLLQTTINYLQNKYNIYRHFLKNLLHYSVKHKSLMFNVAIALPFLDDKAVNSAI